ncbi:hypothetical protein RMATCC62417_14620 [Rhizopus microsporus]|nr:hypothetical protein RMATCC62417_14620 [Rhizopus microsporus]
MTIFQLAKEPKAIVTSSEVDPCTAASQVTVIDAFNTSDATAANKEDAEDNTRPALFVQESHPLGKFKELAKRHPMKVMKVAVKQRKALSSLKGKEVLDFVPRLPRSLFHGVPSMSQPAAQSPLTSSIPKDKGKEVPLHRPSSATINKLPSSNSASEVFDATSTTSNKLTATDIKPSVRKVKHVELEEGETINPCSSLHQTQQACSKNNDKLSCFKHNEAHGNQPVSSSAAKDTAVNSTAASTKRVLSVTAPNANTLEQFKIYTIMFRNLVHTYKQRGDSEDQLTSTLSYFYAFCNCIISSYYNDKQRTSDKPSESVTAWKALLPLGKMLLANLKAQEQYLLYGICLRLVAMVRFRIFDKMQGEVRGVLARHLQAPSISDDLQYIKTSRDLLGEYE